jgi:hypothetical protein
MFILGAFLTMSILSGLSAMAASALFEAFLAKARDQVDQ